MKEKRTSNKTTFIVLTAAFALVAVFAAGNVIHTTANNVSIGWVEQKQSGLWEADYSYFSGAQTSSLQGQNATLNVDVETDEGSLEISVKDTDDNVLFSETISETASFRIDVPEKVMVSVLGKDHDGGFTISY